MIAALIGIWARPAAPPLESVFFTSTLYPIVVDEELTVGTAIITQPANLLLHPTINENVTVGTPPIVAGSLTTTIAYPTYTTSVGENIAVGTPPIVGGALI